MTATGLGRGSNAGPGRVTVCLGLRNHAERASVCKLKAMRLLAQSPGWFQRCLSSILRPQQPPYFPGQRLRANAIASRRASFLNNSSSQHP